MSDPNAQATVARGHNLVVMAPPTPAGTRFVLAGICERLTTVAAHGAEGGLFLAVVPAVAIAEWSRVAERVRGDQAIRVMGAESPARLARLLQERAVDLALTSPHIVLELVRRSALKLDQLSGILVVWPEMWGLGREEALAALFQDIPKACQRVLVTGSPAGTAEVAERYVWRAAVSDLIGAADTSQMTVRTVPASWDRRVAALAHVVEALDPDSVAVWSPDPGDHERVVEGLRAIGCAAQVTSEIPSPVSLVIGFDLPSPALLRELTASGEVVLLVPPGTDEYVARIAPRRRPVLVPGLLDRVQDEHAAARREILQVLDRGPGAGNILALAPLFESIEAPAVAAAVFELWMQSRQKERSPLPAVASPVRHTLWVGAGRRDALTPHDLVAILTRDCGVAKDAIGRIDIRETFSLLELTERADPVVVADCLTGKTVRRKRLVARLDQNAEERRGGGGGGRRPGRERGVR